MPDDDTPRRLVHRSQKPFLPRSSPLVRSQVVPSGNMPVPSSMTLPATEGAAPEAAGAAPRVGGSKAVVISATDCRGGNSRPRAAATSRASCGRGRQQAVWQLLVSDEVK